jgi:glycosyltransferase involved in cell wall biosynthesis
VIDPDSGPRTIAILMKGYPRLSETFIAQEIRSMEKAGFSLRIFAMRRATDKSVHPVHREIMAPVGYLPEFLYEAPVRVLKSLWRARRLPGFGRAFGAFLRDVKRDPTACRFRRFGQAAVMAAEMPADVAWVNVHFIHTPGSVARYATMMSGLPLSITAHAKDIWTTRNWDLKEKLAHAAFAVTCTQAGQKHLNTLALAEKPVRLVYHGLDLKRFRPLTAPASQRNGSSATSPVRLLTVARAVSKKGLDTLVDALAALPSDLHWTWTHIGGGDLLASLQAQAKRHGIADRCRFLGALAQEDVLAAYHASDMFVLPCRIADDGDRDGLPNVLMEAGSQGLALVSTAVSGVTELIDDGETGALIPSDDPVALTGVIRRLVQDPMERYRLGRAVSAKVFRAFDHDQTVRDLMALFPSRLRHSGSADAGRAAAE